MRRALSHRVAVSYVLVPVVVCLYPTAASAQSGSWIANTTGVYNWSDAANWQGGVIADGTNDTADFATAGLTGPMTVSLDSARTIGSLVFDNPTNTFGWTISGSNTLTLSNSAVGGPTVAVNNPQITATLSVPLAGTQALTAAGPGTLILSNDANSYSGGTNVQNGTVQVASDAALGKGDVTGASRGTVNLTRTTATTKSFAMNGGTVSVAAGQTVTFNGGQVSGTYLDGGGTFATDATNGARFINVTTTPSVSITSNSAADQFVHFSNNGNLTAAAGVNVDGTSSIVNINGFTNQGSGTFTVGRTTQINVSNFQSYGTLILEPSLVGGSGFTLITNVGTAPLGFNAGSVTILQTREGPPNQPFYDGLNLFGKNAVVSGGLFVNNGFVADSVGGGCVIVDYGALYKGSGMNFVPIITQNGGKFQAGNSPGQASFGRLVLGPGGIDNYVVAMNDATGTAGPWPDANGRVSGWGLVKAVPAPAIGGGVMTSGTGDFTWTATPAARLTVALDTLINPTTSGTDVPGPMDHFDPSQPYVWPAVEWTGSYSGPADAVSLDAATTFETNGFLNPIAGNFGWTLNAADQTLSLTYTPTAVPEPGTLALSGIAAIGWVTFWRRRWQANSPPPTLSA